MSVALSLLFRGVFIALLLPLLALAAPAGGIAWHSGDVASAFATAKTSNKPLFLYWGAVWCPPCNQVKATIFSQQSFIARSRQFIPVYLDGDTLDAQKLGDQYKVRGYPTMILFKPDGTEITRLPGEVDLDRYLQIIDLGLSASRPVKQIVDSALRGQLPNKAEWQLLADYSWETDQAQVISADELPALLQKLAALVPASEGAALRLRLRALAIALASPRLPPPVIEAAAAQKALETVLADPAQARANFDVLTNYATPIGKWVRSLDSKARATLLERWGSALRQLAQDGSLSMNDRLTAVLAQVQLARLETPSGALADPLQRSVREQVTRADRATRDTMERQAVISTAADILTAAGLLNESDQLLQAELKRSHSPYYFMLALAANAKQRGDAKSALDWYEKAHAAAKGPATRLQWGVSHALGLLELSPQNEGKIETTVGNILTEAGQTRYAFYERNRRALEKLANKLAAWNQDRQHGAAMQRMVVKWETLCQTQAGDAVQKTVCESALRLARK